MLDHSVIFNAADSPSGIGYWDVFNAAAPFSMFAGWTGVMRVAQRAAETMHELGADDPERRRAAGVIDLPTAQKYVNLRDYILERAGAAFRTELPHRFFNRCIGRAAGLRVSPDGRVISEQEWRANAARWLPTPDDMAYVDSLMRRATAPGKIAGWIAPPARGIDGRPWDFECVRFNTEVKPCLTTA